MKFKEWIIAEATLSEKAEKLYQKLADGDIDLEDAAPILIRFIEKWYERHEYSFDYDLFQTRALAGIEDREGDTLKEILVRIGEQLEKKRIRSGIKLKDEEGNEKHDKATIIIKQAPVELPKPIETPKSIEIPKPIELPKPVEIPKPIMALVKYIEPLSFKNFHKPWQQKLDFSPPDRDKLQRKLF